MRKSELFRLPLGNYELTDNINNYQYNLEVGMIQEMPEYGLKPERCYRITLKGGSKFNQIFMIEDYKTENGICYKFLTALAGIGGLRILSDNTFDMLSDLKFIARGSFKQFVANTSNQMTHAQ